MALAAALGGCSAIKLGYNNLPELGWWWLDGYLDFNDAQRGPVRDELTRLHQWHRANELPRYSELLGRVEQMVAADVTPEQVCKLAEEGRTRFLALAGQSEVSIAAIAPLLTPEQLRHLAQRYERNSREFRKDWMDVSPGERRERQFKRFLERMEDAYGRLDEAQRTVLQTLRELRGANLPSAEARLKVRALVDRGQLPPDAGARRYREQVTEDNCALLAAVHTVTTPAQRQRAVRRLRAYQRDLADLSAPR